MITPESLDTLPINFGLIFLATEKGQQLLLYARVVEEQCQTLRGIHFLLFRVSVNKVLPRDSGGASS